MSPHSTSGHRAPAAVGLRRRFIAEGLALAVAAAALLSACGGGGGSGAAAIAGVGSGGTGAFSVGTVTGFGSVFVNGIRYDDTGARLIDDDGTVTVAGAEDNPLRVGMVVEVSGSVDADGTSRSATQIAYGAEVTGPVTEVDAVAGTFSVLGVPLRTTATTIYENVGGVTALAVGDVVEVHGQPDTGGRILATYVQREATSVAAFIAGGGAYRLRGVVDGLDGTRPAYSFTLRGVAVDTDADTDLDGTPANGVSVSVRLNPALQGNGRYLATRLKVRSAGFDDVSTAAEGEVEGYVSDFTNANGAFRVAGYPVRLASGVVYEDGVAADLKDGVRVEAKGSIDNGVLIVTKLEFKSRDDDDDGIDDDVAGESQEYEFKGTAACVTCAAGSGTFTVRGVAVTYDAATEFGQGLSGTTLDGKAVEVKSVGEVGSSGTTYRATRIRLDD